MPGSRAPHQWFTRKGERLSTHDIFGNYVVLAGPEGDSWTAAAASASAALGGVPLDVYRVGNDLGDDEGRFCESYGITRSGASLVRPDGFVAWRSVRDVSDPASALREALAASLRN